MIYRNSRKSRIITNNWLVLAPKLRKKNSRTVKVGAERGRKKALQPYISRACCRCFTWDPVRGPFSRRDGSRAGGTYPSFRFGRHPSGICDKSSTPSEFHRTVPPCLLVYHSILYSSVTVTHHLCTILLGHRNGHSCL